MTRSVQTPSFTCPPVALTIAGSDNSAGAGIQADLKTFAAHGVYGLTAITCVVAEVPGHVSAIQPLPVEIIVEQIRLALRAFPVAVVKTGMLYSREIILAVARILGEAPAGLKLVVDPVMVASSGAPLLEPDAIAAYKEVLFPMAHLVTPNLDETRVISGKMVPDMPALEMVGRRLVREYGVAFLMKGGHFMGDTATDLLVTSDGVKSFRAPFLSDIDTHGSGCTYSSATAAGLARGLDLFDAVASAKDFITGAISRHHRWGCENGTTDALNHFAREARF